MEKLEKWYNKEYLLFILSIAITLFNTVNLQNDTVALMSIPQYLLVFFFLLSKHYRTAFLLHSVFITACVSWGIVIENGVSPYLYTNCRVYGPLTFNIIILVALWISVRSKPIKVKNDSLLLSARKTLLIIFIPGSVIGLIGLLLIEYYDWKAWINQFLFVAEIILFMDIFIHLYNERFSKLFAIVTVCMMAAAPVASVVSFSVFGVQAYYGNDAMPFYTPIMTLCPCLIIAVFQTRNLKLRTISIIGLVFYVLHILILSRGSQYLDIFVALLLLGYLVYFKKSSNFQLRSLKLLLPFVVVFLIPLAITSIVSSSDTSLLKFEQFTSLYKMFDFSSNGLSLKYDEVGSSPYIRVGELANIIHQGFDNIFCLFFGKGYGGYYTDSLHLFSGIDLSKGAFSDASAASGRFYNAHSAIPSVLHFNGLIGLFFMLKLAFNYLRKVDRSFLVFAAFVLYVQTFYFDMYGCFSFIIALFGAEYSINTSSNKVNL